GAGDLCDDRSHGCRHGRRRSARLWRRGGGRRGHRRRRRRRGQRHRRGWKGDRSRRKGRNWNRVRYCRARSQAERRHHDRRSKCPHVDTTPKEPQWLRSRPVREQLDMVAAVKRDYYEVLGVPRDADEEEIRRAFQAQARDWHPDVAGGPEAEERFRELAEAYSVLSRREARALYDRSGYRGRC